MDLCRERWHNIDMKTKISYIVLSALTFSLISGVTPAIAKTQRTAPAPAPRVAYSSPAPAPKAAAPAPAPKAAAPAPAPKAAAPAPAPKAAAPAPAPKAVSTFSYSAPVVPPKQNIVIPSALAANKSPVSTAASKSVSTSSYQTGANNTTSAAEKPKVATFTPTSTLPRITAPVKAYDYSAQTIIKTEISKSETANGDKITQAKDIINSKLVIKPTASTPSKAGMASTLSSITKATGLETVSLVGGKVTAIKPGDVIAINTNKSTNTQYNSTAKLNTSANQKEILKNVEAVKKAGLNTVLIQAYSDSTGKSDYNLGLSQARANEDLKNYAVTMEKNGYSSKDGQWKDATGKVVPASKCTSFCSFTKTGETVPSIQLAAQGKGEVTPNTAGALGAKQAEIVAKGCTNSRAGACAALHDAQRVSLIGGVLDKSLIKISSSTEAGPSIISDPCPPICPPEPQCLNPLGCNTTTTSTTTNSTTTVTSQPASRIPEATSVVPGPVVSSVNPGSTTTSRLPSGGVVSGGSSVGSGAPSSSSSTTGSASTPPTTSTPSSGVSGSAGSSSSGSTLVPPSAGLGGPTTGGTLGSTPSTTTGGSTSTASPAPKFKVS